MAVTILRNLMLKPTNHCFNVFKGVTNIVLFMEILASHKKPCDFCVFTPAFYFVTSDQDVFWSRRKKDQTSH